MGESIIQSEQLSLAALVKKYKRIVIPILQRDYAQGRKGEGELRKNFLAQLRGFLLSAKSFNDLDFVYGNIENDPERFIPLDGQQRLTTLFLMHYYLSIHDGVFPEFQETFGIKGTDGAYESRFSYETRDSSIVFCDAILNNPVDLTNLAAPDLNKKKVSLKNDLSKTLKNYGWFIDSWTYDPTIDSMLRMLDAIHYAFKDDMIGLYAKLVSEESPKITFRELPMRDNGLNEDLYVKMNSRGLPLTRFEKIKAKMIQMLKASNESRKLSRSSAEQEKDTNIASYFSYKIDTVWSYMFWPYRTEKVLTKQIGDIEDSYTVREIDSRLLNFIAAIASNYQASVLGVKELDLKLMDSAPKSSWASFSKLEPSFFLHLIDVFDAFSRQFDNKGIILYSDDLAIDVKSVFKSVVDDSFPDRAYKQRIWLYAYYSFMIQYQQRLKESDLRKELQDWCRIVMNLTENNRYDSETDYCNTISFISDLLKLSEKQGILKLLSSKQSISPKGVDQRQFKEERIKAWAILNGVKDWSDSIIEAEKNAYLTGQIISLLHLSGLEHGYDEYLSAEIPDYSILDQTCLSAFNRYSELINELFIKDGLNPKYEEEQIFRRALLAKGDYSMSANSNQSLLNNGSRDVSWKRYLHQSPEHLRALSALLNPNITNLEQHLNAAIKDRGVIDLNDWIGILVNTPQIWKKMNWYEVQSRRFIRFYGESGFGQHIYPLKLQRMSGDHYEMRSLYKYYCLKANTILESIQAISSYSDDTDPYLKISNGTIQFCIYYNYQPDFTWRIEMWKEDELDIPENLLEKSSAVGFIPVLNDSGKAFHSDKKVRDEDLEAELVGLIEKQFFCN